MSGPASDYKGEELSKIGVVPVILGVAFEGQKHIVTGLFRDKATTQASYRRHVFYGFVRKIVSDFSVLQAQWLTPGTDRVYRMMAMAEGKSTRSVMLDKGAKGHWIGDPNATYAMLYFHGGGYIQAATTGHMRYQFKLQQELTRRGHSFAILSLSYTLAPHALYPQQLEQAVSALEHLLERRDPSTIIVAGDSAGGNLAAALLMHLARPHPRVAPVRLAKRLHSAVLISPWVCFDSADPSVARNARSDYLTIKATARASRAFIGPHGQHDVYSQPVKARADWWRDVGRAVVEDVMVWCGGGEILRDGICKFADTVADGFADEPDAAAAGRGPKDVASQLQRVTLLETPGCAHEEMIIDHLWRLRRKNYRQDSAVAVEDWLDGDLSRWAGGS